MLSLILLLPVSTHLLTRIPLSFVTPHEQPPQQQQQQQQYYSPHEFDASSPLTTPEHESASAPDYPHSAHPPRFHGDPSSPILTTPCPTPSPSLPTLPPPPPPNPLIPPLLFLHPHPFPLALRLFLTKYPSPHSPDVLSCAVSDERTDPDTSVVYRRRVLRVHNSAPFPFRHILRAPVIEFEERSLYDPARRVLELSTRNLTYRSIIEAREASKFIGVGDHSTLFVQAGGITAGAFFGPLRASVERYAAWYVRSEGVKAIDLLERMLREADTGG